MKKYKDKLAAALVPPLALVILRLLGMTWRLRERGETEQSPNQGAKGRLYAIWHGSLLPAVWHYRRHPITAMISRNKDGELIARALLLLGYPAPARGSSSRGGATALRGMADTVEAGGHALLTPDGPRGPRHSAQAGVLALAKLTGRPVVPVGVHSSRRVLFRSWDRFCLPLPLSRNTFCFGKPIHVPADADAHALEALRGRLESEMLRLDEEAGR